MTHSSLYRPLNSRRGASDKPSSLARRAALIGALFVLAAPLSSAQIALPVTFEDGDATFYELTDFGGNMSSLVADPDAAANTVVASVRTAASECFAGTTVADASGFTAPIPFAEGATTMSVRVRSPEAGIRVLMKVEQAGVPEVSVETVAFTTMAGAWETMVFDFGNERTGTAALNLASTYTKASIFFDFSCDLDPAPPAPPERTYYWDDVTFGGEVTGGIALPVTFEDGDAAFYELTDFGGNASSVAADPDDAANMVVESVRLAGEGVATCFAGTTVANTSGFTAPIPFAEGATTMSVRVRSPEAGIRVLLKVEDVSDAGIFVETLATTTMAGAWETLVFDFGNPMPNATPINFANTYNKASIFFDFSCDLDPAPPAPPERTYYWDDVTFGGDSGPSTTPIADVRAAGTGMEFTISGVVTRAMGDFSYVQDATGAITIRQTSGDYFDDVADGTIVPGTMVTITGTTSEFRGLFQINSDDLTSYSVDGTAGVPAAQTVTIAELAANGEAYEAELVEVTGLTTTETGAFAAGTNYTVNDGADDGTLRVPNEDDSVIDGTDIPAGAFTFTGVVGQFTFADPATDGYQLLAIATGDVVEPPMPVVSLPIRFEDDIDYELVDFGGNSSSLVEDPEDAANMVVASVRTADAACFAGTTVADVAGFTSPIPFAQAVGSTTMNVKVWTPVAGTPVRLKVEQVGVPEVSVEAQVLSTMSGAWEVLVFDFANQVDGTAALNFASIYNKASIFFDFSCGVTPPPPAPPERTYYWDDVAFGSEAPVSEEGGVTREDVQLTQNHPNPFSERTTIHFTLPAQDHVQVVVYNQLGQMVTTLVDGPLGAGTHAIPFDASGLASGTYFYRLNHSDVSVTRSMVLTR